MNGEFVLDDEQVRKMFAELDSKNRNKVFKTAIRKALTIVKKHAIQNLKSVVDSASINHKDRFGNTFRKGIKIKVNRNAQGGLIHILGDYRLKFFEMGTKDRYTKTFRGKALKKKKYTGRITASHFFKRACQSSEAETFNSIEQLIVQSIVKINNKYKGK